MPQSDRVVTTVFKNHNPLHFIHVLEENNVRYWGHECTEQTLIETVSGNFTLCCLFFFLKKAYHNIFLKGHVILSQQDTSCVELKKGGSLHNSMLHLLICHIAHSTLKTERGSDCLTTCEYSRTCRIEKQVFKKVYHSREGCDTDLYQHPGLRLFITACCAAQLLSYFSCEHCTGTLWRQ